MVSSGQCADDFCSGIVDAAKRSDLGSDFWSDVFSTAEISSFQDGGLYLVRLEKAADIPRDLIRFRIFPAEENIDGNIF